MAYFNPPPVSSDTDMKKIKSYIRMLNDQLQYSLTNIDPEDNFSLDAMVKYRETDEAIGLLEISMEGLLSEFKNLQTGVESKISVMNGEISLKVSVDEMCSEISAYPGEMVFRTGYVIFDTNNFKLDKQGNVEYSGAIKGGSININDKFMVDEKGSATIASSTFTKRVNCSGMLYTNYLRIEGDANISGQVSCDSMNVSGIVSCEILYERSDRRLKEDIMEIPDQQALDVVLGLRPVTFRFRGSGRRSMGYVAQDVEMLRAEKGIDLPLTEMAGEYYAIPYGAYGALYAGAIRAQQKQIDELEELFAEEEMEHAEV